MSKPANNTNAFPYITVRVTEQFKKRLEWAILQRQKDHLLHVTPGFIVSELAQHLPPHPDEQADPTATPPKKPAVAAPSKPKAQRA